MDQDRIEADADSNSCAESETLSISDASSQEENSRSIGGREPKNKMKLRSIKLSRLPSFGSCIRAQKSPSTQSPCLVSGCAASSQQSTPVAMPDGPPNFTKATNCSDAKNGSLQKSAGMLTRRSSFKSKKSLTRTSSKRKLKKTRSTKVASFGSSGSYTIEESAQHDQPSIVLKADFQASPPNSECSDGIGSNDKDRIDAEVANSTSHSSVRVLKKTSSLRPQRILTKTASSKSKRPARKKCTQVSEIPDSNVERATCSSTLKDNKFPRQVEVKTGGGESGGNSAMKVCPYTYCSLHGHRHGNVPPLKRFVSMRRRLLKNQKNMKLESRSIPKAKRSTNRRKGTQTSQTVCKGDSANKGTVQDKMANSSSIEKVFEPELNSASSHSGEDKHIGDCANLAQTLLNETTLHPNPSIEQHKTSDSLNTKPQTQMAFSAVQETSEECCCIPTEPIKLVLEISNTDNKEGHISASSAHSGDDEPILSVDHHKFTETSTTTWVMGKEKKENFEPDNDFLKGNSPSGDCTTDEPHTQTEKRKYTGLWGMIYQHMKSGIAAEVETELPLDGKDKEEQLKDENALLQKNESVCLQTSLSGKDQKIGMGEYEARDKKFEPWQSDTIKLVREAFDNILSEIPDNSSDDQSISSDITSEQDLLEKNHSEGGERNILSSFECTKENIKLDPEESETEAVDINNKAFEEEKAASKQENKSSQQISKNWSNLKKVIMLKRFVKALEKVRKFNPRKPRFLSVEPDPETEKVNLRHQTLEERKNAEEWMLDYALRQVISDLAPAQKRKVALLVQAFETVTLPTDIKTRLSFNAEFSSHAAPVQACTGSPIRSSGQNNSGSLGKAPYLEMSFKETPDEVSNISTSEQHIPGTCSELTERDLSGCSNAEVDMSASETAQTNLEDEETVAFNLERKDHNSILTDDHPALVDISSRKREEPRLSNKSSSKPDDTGSTSPEEFPVSGKVHPEVSKEVILIHDSEVCDCNIKFDSKKLETGNLIDADGEQSCELKSELSSIVSSVVSSDSFPELSEEIVAACDGKANSQREVLQEFSPQAKSEPHDTIDMDNLIDAGGEQSGEPKSELSSIVSSVISSASFSKLSDEPMAACGGQANPEHEVLQQSSPQEESELHDTNDTQPEYKLEKQKYMRLWYLVYKHMVSSSVEDGAQPLEGKDKEDQEGDANKLLGTEDADSCKDWSEMNQKMLMDNQIASSQIIECHNIEAIKLIEEAIDDINLQEIQDDSTDDQSITGNKISEPDFQMKHGESRDSEDSFRESNKTKIEQGTALDPKETRLDSDNINALEESETESKLVNKCKPQTLKSWSNLKRLILVKRFTKALEKVRKFNPRKPQYLCLDSDSEAEKVNLRHQNMEDRKIAEEWMLDHALQQVVAKLTPARKRKVELLIEAFETVTPSLEVKTLQHHSTADSPHARLIHV